MQVCLVGLRQFQGGQLTLFSSDPHPQESCSALMCSCECSGYYWSLITVMIHLMMLRLKVDMMIVRVVAVAWHGVACTYANMYVCVQLFMCACSCLYLINLYACREADERGLHTYR